MIRIFTACVAVVSVAGCATSADVEMARAHYEAQAAQDRPLLRLEAQPGETIVLSGVRQLVVHTPSDDVTPFRKQHHPVWGILGETLRAVAPIAAVGHYSVRLADTVGESAGDVATGSYNTEVDASDNSQTNSGRVGSDDWSNAGRIDSPNDSTHSPTVVEQPEPVVVQPEPEVSE